MKTNFLLKVFTLFIILSISSCHNLFKDDEKDPEPEYLVNYELERSYLPVIVESMFNQLVTNYPEMEEIRERIKHGLVVYRITYKTTFEGEPIIASGLVSAPMEEGIYPMISYQNGTNTLHRNAPSVNPDRDFYVLLESVASTGFVVAMPDYLGFGATDDMFHPYLHKNATVPVVIDMLRAVEELGELRGFGLSNDLYLTGYSLGGWATLQVQKEIEANHFREFNLKASAPGAGPYDLNFIYDHVLNQETYPMPYFMGFVFDSYTNMEEISTPLNEILNAPYDSLVPTLYNGSLSGEEINEYLTTNISELFTENFLANRTTDTLFTSISQALADNSVDIWSISSPTHFVHSTGDELVPFEVSQRTYQEFLDAGTNPNNIELVPIPDLSHNDGIIPSGLYALQWFFEIRGE